MKRSGPISRKTPLRTAKPDWMRVQKRRFAKQYHLLRTQVLERDRGLCVACGDALGAYWECHHRKFRSRGGRNELSNLIAVCGRCHKRIHVYEPTLAQVSGWAVSSTDEPAEIPVRYADGSVRLLTDEEAAA